MSRCAPQIPTSAVLSCLWFLHLTHPLLLHPFVDIAQEHLSCCQLWSAFHRTLSFLLLSLFLPLKLKFAKVYDLCINFFTSFHHSQFLTPFSLQHPTFHQANVLHDALINHSCTSFASSLACSFSISFHDSNHSFFLWAMCKLLPPPILMQHHLESPIPKLRNWIFSSHLTPCFVPSSKVLTPQTVSEDQKARYIHLPCCACKQTKITLYQTLKVCMQLFFFPQKVNPFPFFFPTIKASAITVHRTDVNASPFQLSGIYANRSTVSFRSHILLSLSDIIHLSESHSRVTSTFLSCSCCSLSNFSAKAWIIQIYLIYFS